MVYTYRGAEIYFIVVRLTIYCEGCLFQGKSKMNRKMSRSLPGKGDLKVVVVKEKEKEVITQDYFRGA